MNLITKRLPFFKNTFSAFKTEEDSRREETTPLPTEQDLIRAGALLAREYL